ncbi:hypothetical protein HaLaN_12223 [Haematococcus lacustris]|uniref:Uncharacterized protein n=1 Tax=Haematococcus lacustris TaxID=44745 RepID=A0A699Z2S8_HAELA|nr:hypothetical protein HaLaN_12223 [Haematococcus lacustris]
MRTLLGCLRPGIRRPLLLPCMSSEKCVGSLLLKRQRLEGQVRPVIDGYGTARSSQPRELQAFVWLCTAPLRSAPLSCHHGCTLQQAAPRVQAGQEQVAAAADVQAEMDAYEQLLATILPPSCTAFGLYRLCQPLGMQQVVRLPQSFTYMAQITPLLDTAGHDSPHPFHPQPLPLAAVLPVHLRLPLPPGSTVEEPGCLYS